MRRAFLALLLAGCSYDWTVAGSSASDAGRDVVLTDGSIDATDAPSADVMMVSDASDAGSTDSTTGDEPDAADCAQLEQNVVSAFEVAKTCTSGCTTSTCQTPVPDQCGCNVIVCNDGMAPNTVAYKNAVNTFKGSGCLAQYTCGDTCTQTTFACSFRPDAGTYGCYY